jgi:hypothetical protein
MLSLTSAREDEALLYNALHEAHMTLPIERSRTIESVEHFLKQLCNPKETPKVPRAVRRRAGQLLKHYPREYDMYKARKNDPATWGELDEG